MRPAESRYEALLLCVDKLKATNSNIAICNLLIFLVFNIVYITVNIMALSVVQSALLLVCFALMCDTIHGKFLYLQELSQRVKIDFVRAHNMYRSRVRPPAADMRRLEWDESVAMKAVEFVKKCSFAHSYPALSTGGFHRLGENVYAGNEYRYSGIPWGVTALWYSERDYYNINGNPTCMSGKACGHYKQVVWAKSRKMGCAIGRCSHILGGNGNTLVACLYGPEGNQYLYEEEILPYTVGTPCSQCPEDAPMCVARLCI